jgi:hypothetical protein
MTGAQRPFALVRAPNHNKESLPEGCDIAAHPRGRVRHHDAVTGRRRHSNQPGLACRRGGRRPVRRRSTRTSIRVIWRDPASSVRRATSCVSRNRTWVANAGSSHATTSASPSIATGRVRAAMTSPTTSHQRSKTTSMPARLGAPRRPRTRSRVSASRIGCSGVPARGCQPTRTVNHLRAARTVLPVRRLPPPPRRLRAAARRRDGRPPGGHWPWSEPSARAAGGRAGRGCAPDRAR